MAPLKVEEEVKEIEEVGEHKMKSSGVRGSLLARCLIGCSFA